MNDGTNNTINSSSEMKNKVRKKVMEFYEAYYKADRLNIYCSLDTSFQRQVPLNYFLIHTNYNIEMGRLLNINEVEVKEEKRMAFVECEIQVNDEIKDIVFILKKDFGGWKMDGESIFKRTF
ncbi:MAG: hypothetical protein VB095_06785 [Anaerovorax sp.]|nr:hypothetical protein [Anaerovorax sp.]